MMLSKYNKFVKDMRKQKEEWKVLLYNISKLNSNFNKSSQVFFKSHIVDSTCADSIDGLEYIDNEGYDFIFNKKYRVSGKCSKRIFGKKSTYDITITNIRGKHRDFIKENFDAMLIIQTDGRLAVAAVPFKTVCEYKKGVCGQIQTKIPTEKLDFIVHPDENISPCSDNMHDVDVVFQAYVSKVSTLIREQICHS